MIVFTSGSECVNLTSLDKFLTLLAVEHGCEGQWTKF